MAMKKRIGGWLLLLFACALLHAEEFGPVTVESIPLPEGGGSEGYCVAAFRVVNRLKTKPAEVVFAFSNPDRGFLASRTILVPPDSARTVDLGWPSVNSAAFLELRVNGKSYETSIGVRPNWGAKAMIWAGEIASDDPLRKVLEGEDSRSGSVPLAANQWPADLRLYYGAKTILLDSGALPPPATMKTLEEWAALGGTLVIRVAPGASWPEGVPGRSERYYNKRIEFGRKIVVQPLLANEEKIIAEYLRKTREVTSWGGFREKTAVKLPKTYTALSKLESDVNAGVLPELEIKHVAYPPPRIPLGTLAVVMGVFVVLIGPVNYLVLRRKKKEMLLLVTVPAISFTFCILVILFITFSEGWYSRGKALGETRLDQTTGRAVTKSAMSFYAPLPPGGGFAYQADELLKFPAPGRVRLDLNREQHFDSSLLAPRIPLNVQLQSVRERREQLRISVADGGRALEVVNGLGVPLSALVAVAPDGSVFLSEKTIPAGEKILLTETIGKSVAKETPNEFCFEKKPRELGRFLPPGFYAAYIPQAHFYSTGIQPEEFDARHLVIGKYGEQNHAN